MTDSRFAREDRLERAGEPRASSETTPETTSVTSATRVERSKKLKTANDATPMKRSRARISSIAAIASLALLGAVACATPPPHRQPPDFASRFEAVRTITLVPPKIAVYEMSAGSTEEEVQAWSDEAQAHVVEAVKAEVAELGRTYVPFAGQRPHADLRVGTAREREAAGGLERTPAEDSWLLFEAANLAIMRHAYDPWHTFPNSMKAFDYTLGDEAASMLGGTPADAFMLVVAVDHVPTRHRQALVAMGLGMAAMTGSYAGPGATPAKLTLAMVEAKTGDILWFNTLALPFTDLRDEATDEKLVDTVMKGLPR
jgi:hypothetical protein